jgi:hypothetical protein
MSGPLFLGALYLLKLLKTFVECALVQRYLDELKDMPSDADPTHSDTEIASKRPLIANPVVNALDQNLRDCLQYDMHHLGYE